MFKSRRRSFKLSRLKVRRRRRLIGRLVLFFIFVGLLAVGLSYLSRSDFLAVKEILVSGSEAAAGVEIKQLAENYLIAGRRQFFSQGNILFYPRRSVEREILKSHLEIEAVKIAFNWPKRRMTVALTERRPVGFWCRPTGPISESIAAESSAEPPEERPSCLLLDRQGLLFKKISGQIPAGLFEFSGPAADFSPGSDFLPPAVFERALKLLDLLRSAGLEPKKFSIGEFQQISFAGQARIIFDLTTDQPEKIMGNFLILANDSEFGRPKNLLEPFDYVDLRFGNKVLYKLKN